MVKITYPFGISANSLVSVEVPNGRTFADLADV